MVVHQFSLMNISSRSRLLIPAIMSMALFPLGSHAALILESWDYSGKTDGTEITAANDFDGGTGWSGAEWLEIQASSTVGYSSVGNLAYTATGYTNANATGSGGLFGIATQGNSNKGVFREFSPTALTDTVYVSFVFATNTANGVQSSVFIQDLDAGTQGLGFRAEASDNDAGLAWGTDDNGNLYDPNNERGTQYAFNEGNGDFSATNLAILKFETNYSGAFDRVTMYLNPTNVSSEAQASATASVSIVDGSDIWGASLTGSLASHTRTGGAIDQFRIAYGADGFQQLVSGVAVPEPGTALLFLIGLAFLLNQRRQRLQAG